MRDGLVWADTSLPPLEPIRIIIKITRRSLWPWLPSISIRNPSLSPSGRSETSFSITRLALCLGEQVATATSPNGDISTVDICFFACLSVCACLSVFAFSVLLFLFRLQEREPDSLIQIPDPYKSGGLYTPGPRNSLENRDTLASPSSPIKRKERGRGSSTNKKIKALPCLFIGLFMGVRILERLSRLLIGTGYSISGLHVEFSLAWQQLPALLIFCYRRECLWSFFNWGASKPSDWSTAAS